MHCFGRWNDPDGAMQAYHDFLAGKPKAKPCHVSQDQSKPDKPYPEFLLLAHSAWDEYKLVSDQLVKYVGKGRLVADLDPRTSPPC